MVQNLASKAQEGSGDGTTTACILAQAFCNVIFAHLDDNKYTTHFVMKMFDAFRIVTGKHYKTLEPKYKQ